MLMEGIELEVQFALSGECIGHLKAEASWTVRHVKEALKDLLATGTCAQALLSDTGHVFHDSEKLADMGVTHRLVMKAVVGRDAIGSYVGGNAERSEEGRLVLLASGHSEFHACVYGRTSTSSQQYTLFGSWAYTTSGQVQVDTVEREYKSDLVKPLLNQFLCRDAVAEGSGNWGTSRGQYKKTLIFEWTETGALHCQLMPAVTFERLADEGGTPIEKSASQAGAGLAFEAGSL